MKQTKNFAYYSMVIYSIEHHVHQIHVDSIETMLQYLRFEMVKQAQFNNNSSDSNEILLLQHKVKLWFDGENLNSR